MHFRIRERHDQSNALFDVLTQQLVRLLLLDDLSSDQHVRDVTVCPVGLGNDLRRFTGLERDARRPKHVVERRRQRRDLRPQNVAILQVALGADLACAIRPNGVVACWGYNAWGQLGDGATANRNLAVNVTGITNATEIAGEMGSSYALRADGTVSAWGLNTYGQLGDGTTRARNTQAPVLGLTDAVEIVSTMDYFSSYSSLPYADRVCARRRSGTVVCWGYNGNGQVGDSTTTNRLTPTAVVGLSDVTELAPAGRRHTCARCIDGTVACWGYGVSGQLGNGMSVPRTAPVTVTGVP